MLRSSIECGCCTRDGCFGRRFGDPDVLFGYNTPAFVKVRDKRLGLTFISLQVIIFVYVLIYSVLIQQRYRRQGVIFGSARLQLVEPNTSLRMPQGHVPYCLGTNSSPSIPGYTFPEPGKYTYNGALPYTNQGVCQYQDAALAIPDVFLPGGSFVPTRLSITPQAISPPPVCVGLEDISCQWTPAPGSAATKLAYIADPELFTVFVDHTFSSTVGIAKSGQTMSGVILGKNGLPVDPCNVYRNRGLPCPSFVNIGVANTNDIVPVAALLEAAGVTSLDAMGRGPSGPGLSGQLLRYTGLILYVQVTYTNYYLSTDIAKTGTGDFSQDAVQYIYEVTAAFNTQFKGQTYAASDLLYPPNNRTYIDAHGIRINVVQAGSVGAFDFMVGSAFIQLQVWSRCEPFPRKQTMIIQLTTALGLLAVASVIVDFIMLNLCATRALLRQYKMRLTGDTTSLPPDLLTKSFMQQFERNPYALHAEFPVAIDQALRNKDLATGSFRANTGPGIALTDVVVASPLSLTAMHSLRSGSPTPSTWK